MVSALLLGFVGGAAPFFLVPPTRLAEVALGCGLSFFIFIKNIKIHRKKGAFVFAGVIDRKTARAPFLGSRGRRVDAASL